MAPKQERKIDKEFAEFLFAEEQTLMAKQRTALSFLSTGLASLSVGVAILTLVNTTHLRWIGWITLLLGLYQIYEGYTKNRRYEHRLENLKEMVHQLGIDYYEHFRDSKDRGRLRAMRDDFKDSQQKRNTIKKKARKNMKRRRQ